MIPIASSISEASLTIEKASKLLRKLVDLKKNTNVELPEEISTGVDNLLRAQQKFLEGIDDYLHQPSNYTNEDNIETVTEIVQTCPDLLAIKDKFGQLPCYIASRIRSSSANRYLLLFADIGCQHNIGGEENRGGLLIKSNDQHFNPLQHIRDPSVFDALQKHNPPLLHIKDVRRNILLHVAVRNFSLNLVKYFCNLNPSCLYQKLGGSNKLPIHCAIEREKNDGGHDIVQYLLQQSVLYSVSNRTIGGLFTKMPNSDRLVLDALVKKWGREKAWDCIERAISTYKDLNEIPILHQTITHAPQYFTDVINRFPNSSYVRNNRNRLPIHVALERGMKFSFELTYLMKGSHEDLREVDPVTKWPPFVLAAMGTSCDLRTIYGLLREYPEHVERWRDDTKSKPMPIKKSRKRRRLTREIENLLR